MSAKIETRNGSRIVIGFCTGAGYDSRLYVNNGNTATLTSARHKTEAGARKWADKVLNR